MDNQELKPKSFWKRPEGVTGMIFMAGLIIGGGTAQIQKNMIGERALGLPKEPKLEA